MPLYCQTEKQLFDSIKFDQFVIFTHSIEMPDDEFMEKLAFQCANVVGRSFNNAHPFLDSESEELRINFVHDSIARNGIACVIRKTPAKIRLEKDSA